MKNAVTKYGLVSGALISVIMMLTIPFHDQIGFDTRGLVVGYTTMVLAFLLIYSMSVHTAILSEGGPYDLAGRWRLEY